MTTVLVYDTETTGIHWGFKNRSVTDPSHPHLCQIAALVLDVEDKRVRQSMSMIVAPDGWGIPDKAVKIHGISSDYAAQWGLPEKQVLEAFLALWAGGNQRPLERVAHNAKFDRDVIATAIARYYGQGDLLDTWLAGTDTCTMLTSKPLVQARNVKGAIKNPNLMETYKHFFDEEFDRSHTANADTVATMQIFLALQELGQ